MNRDEILQMTDGGRKIYQLLLPNLNILTRTCQYNVDSIISSGKNCFSVFRCDGKWLFKDHYSKISGDIFKLIALIHKLDIKKDFRKVLEIIAKMLSDAQSTIREDQKISYFDNETFSLLTIGDEEVSKGFVENNFFRHCPFLKKMPKYKVHLAIFFDIEVDGKQLLYEYDFAKPDEAYYALEIVEGQYYWLYNPTLRKDFVFGKTPEFFIPGMDSLFNAYYENIAVRQSLIITNRIDGLLWCQENSLPCIALLNGDIELSEYFEKFILPLFPDRKLMLEYVSKGSNEILTSFPQRYGFENIITGQSYFCMFFQHCEDPVDKILNNLELLDDYEYVGHASPVVNLADDDTDYDNMDYDNF